MARKKSTHTEDTPSPTPPVGDHHHSADATPASPAAASSTLPTTEAAIRALEPRPTLPNPFQSKRDYAAGVTLQEDRAYRQIQLKFDDKPSDPVRAVLRAAGFTWHRERQVWQAGIEREAPWKARNTAEKVFEQVTAMIREERGIARQVG